MHYKVFLDTNIYDATNYTFRSGIISKLCEYASASLLELQINRIVEGEVRRHITERIGRIEKEYFKMTASRDIAGLKTLQGYEFLNNDSNNWSEAVEKEFIQFLNKCNVEHLSLDNVRPEEVFSDYFQCVHPFEASKKNEFPDAFIIQSIIAEIGFLMAPYDDEEECDLTYCVVSADKGFRKAFGHLLDNKNIRLFDSLHSFLNFMAIENGGGKRIQGILDSGYGEGGLCQLIEDALLSMTFDVYESDGDVEYVECNAVDQIEHDGLSLDCAENLMGYCYSLDVNSSGAMMAIDNDFDFAKKYSLSKDILILTKELYTNTQSIYAFAKIDIVSSDTIGITKYDNSCNRLYCKYIRNGVAVLKTFHILLLLQTTPLYSDGIQLVSSRLTEILREVLFNKRIIKFVVDADLYGESNKFHKTTRLKIYFAMSNSDRYCIRLDFPHDDINDIHINLDEPSHNKSTGFPFCKDRLSEVVNKCGSQSIFDQLFYFQDDLYWFKGDFEVSLKKLKKDCIIQTDVLDIFYQTQTHILLLPDSTENRDIARGFSEAFADAYIEHGTDDVYGKTDSEDNDLYAFTLFQDVLYVISLLLQNCSKNEHLFSYAFLDYKANESRLEQWLIDFIKKHFIQDKELMSFVNHNLSVADLITCCLDYLDTKHI